MIASPLPTRRATAIIVLLGLLAAAQPARAAAPLFVAHSVATPDRTGTLEALGADWSVQLGGTDHTPIRGADLVSLRRPRVALPARPVSEQLIFANGDCLPGVILRLRGERVRIHAFDKDGPELNVPLSTLSVIWLVAPETQPSPELFLRGLAHESRRRDVVFLRNGDTLQGVVLSYDRQAGVRARAGGKTSNLPVDKVAAIALNTRLARLRVPTSPYGHLLLTNGTRLAITSAEVHSNKLRCKTLFGTGLDVPLFEVCALDIYQGPAVYLSELRPRAYSFRSYLGSDRASFVVDGSVVPGAPFGGPMSLQRSWPDHGVGMAGASRLSYALDGHYRWFEATVGLDDSGRQGYAQIQVLVDGRPAALGWDGKLTWRRGTKTVRINVAGARDLVLIVDFSERGNVWERIDWADARLLR